MSHAWSLICVLRHVYSVYLVISVCKHTSIFTPIVLLAQVSLVTVVNRSMG